MSGGMSGQWRRVVGGERRVAQRAGCGNSWSQRGGHSGDGREQQAERRRQEEELSSMAAEEERRHWKSSVLH